MENFPIQNTNIFPYENDVAMADMNVIYPILWLWKKKRHSCCGRFNSIV